MPKQLLSPTIVKHVLAATAKAKFGDNRDFIGSLDLTSKPLPFFSMFWGVILSREYANRYSQRSKKPLEVENLPQILRTLTRWPVNQTEGSSAAY